MEKLFRRSILSAFVCLALVFFIANAPTFAQEKKAGKEKLYNEIAGKYQFDVEGQVMVIGFWVENGKLLAAPEGEDSVEIEPVEGEELKFTTTTPEGQYYEITFVRDDEGKVTKCVIGVQGMEFEGSKIKDDK